METRDHVLAIEVQYFLLPGEVQKGSHQWRATCTCGFTSAWGPSRSEAEQATEAHRAAHPR